MSGFFAAFRWVFMPLGLFALVAVGVHASADLVDDRLLIIVEQLDAFFDTLFARTETLASWVNAIDTRERTLIARGVTLAWELGVDFFIALPALGYSEADEQERKFSIKKETWRTLLARLNKQPTPMRLLRPVVTAIFALGGAYAVSRLVESSLFVGLEGGVAPPDVAAVLARVFGGVAMVTVTVSLGWRATLRALLHADQACVDAPKNKQNPWLIGLVGTVLALPLALALALEARALLSFVL